MPGQTKRKEGSEEEMGEGKELKNQQDQEKMIPPELKNQKDQKQFVNLHLEYFKVQLLLYLFHHWTVLCISLLKNKNHFLILVVGKILTKVF